MRTFYNKKCEKIIRKFREKINAKISLKNNAKFREKITRKFREKRKRKFRKKMKIIQKNKNLRKIHSLIVMVERMYCGRTDRNLKR